MAGKDSSQSVKRYRLIIRILLATAILLGIFLIAHQTDPQEALREILTRISELGYRGYLVYVLLYIIACIAFLPGAILTLAAGFIFGLLKGTIMVSVASILGASCAFLVGRYLARDWVARRIAGHARFRAVDEAVGREGWKIVLLTRLSPVFPFNLLNYAFGLTRVRFKHYFFASWAGMLPGTILYVYIGSLAGSLATLENRERGAAEWIFYGLGLLATIAVTIFVTRLARKALDARFSS